MTKDNHLLGKFTLQGIRKAPRGVPQVEVQMDVDENGILHVKATDLDGGATESVEISNDGSRLSKDEINRMVEEAQEFEEADKKTRELAQAKVQLEQTAHEYRVKAQSDEYKRALSEEEIKVVEEAATEGIQFADENAEATVEEFQAKLQEIKGRADEILAKGKAAVDANKGSEASGASQEEEEAPVAETVSTDDEDEF